MQSRGREPRASSTLRIVVPAAITRGGSLEQRIRDEQRPAVYDEVLSQLATKVDAAHRRLVEDGDVLPERLPNNRALTGEELDELTWRVYCLITALRLSFVRCHPTVLLMAAMWWGSEQPRWWEWFCQAHWP